MKQIKCLVHALLIKDGNNCKHMFALILKLKCYYDKNKIEKIIKKELKDLKNNIKVNDGEYIKYKYI